MALGPSNSRPGSPLQMASGRRPKAVTSAVMKIWVNLSGAPRRSSAGRSSSVGLMPEPKIRLEVNVAVAAEAEGGRVGEGFQFAVCTGVVEQAF